MNRVRSFFLTEAEECLRILAKELDAPTPDVRRAHGAARLLRGSAQMARYGAVADRAAGLERGLKPVARGHAPWTAELAGAARRDVAALASMVGAVRSGGLEADSTTELAMSAEQSSGDVVPIEELEYAGERALERALELRGPLEDAIVAEQPVGPLLEELFGLVRLGMR